VHYSRRPLLHAGSASIAAADRKRMRKGCKGGVQSELADGTCCVLMCIDPSIAAEAGSSTWLNGYAERAKNCQLQRSDIRSKRNHRVYGVAEGV